MGPQRDPTVRLCSLQQSQRDGTSVPVQIHHRKQSRSRTRSSVGCSSARSFKARSMQMATSKSVLSQCDWSNALCRWQCTKSLFVHAVGPRCVGIGCQGHSQRTGASWETNFAPFVGSHNMLWRFGRVLVNHTLFCCALSHVLQSNSEPRSSHCAKHCPSCILGPH